MKMSDADFASSSIRRAWEPPEEVVVPAGLAYSPQLQPEDYGVLIRLLLRDPEKSSSVKALSEEFQASGWKMGDSRLRGVMRRLRAAGHVHRGRDGYDSESGRPKWAFAVYRNPQNNPEHRDRPAAFSQVGRTRGFSTDRVQAPVSDALDSNVYAGQTDPLESDASGSNASAIDALDSNVYAGQTDPLNSDMRGVAPPTPPPGEEEDSSSPPSTATAASGVSDNLRIQAASEFLAELPGQWACGRKTIRVLAPLLSEAAYAQGWPLDAALAAHLTQRTRRKTQKESADLLRDRIEDLPRYTAAAAQQLKLPEPSMPGDGTPSSDAPPPVADPAAVHDARALLLSLDGPWVLSPESADRLAPVLAVRALERGWVFDDELRAKLMENPGGAHNHELLLETRRIGCLPYRKARRQFGPGAEAGTGRQMCRKRGHGGGAFPVDDCPACVSEARPRREDGGKLDTASLIAALHSRGKEA